MGSLPMRERGLKWVYSIRFLPHFSSLPMRGAWIEMMLTISLRTISYVAPHAGSVD